MLIWPKKQNLTEHKNLLSDIKMGKEILTFGHIEIEKKKKIYHHKIPIILRDENIDNKI